MNPADRAIAPYAGPEAAAYHEGKRALPPEAIPWVCRARAQRLAGLVRPSDEVFEFGCGLGWNLGALACARRVGHDVAASLCPSVESLGVEFAADPDALPAGSFDLVLCHHALEHVLHPPRVFATLHRLLRPTGRLVVVVPYDEQRRLQRFDPAEPNHHLYSWSPQTLGALVTVCGFEVRTAGLRRYGYDRRAAKIAARLKVGERGFLWVRRALQALRPLREVEVTAVRPSLGPEGPRP